MSINLPGPRKRMDAELNLVPYIDLLTCMIAFLLITAVWTQLARLQVRQHGQGGDQDDRPAVRLVVLVGDHGFNVLAPDDRQILPRLAAGHDFGALKQALQKLKGLYPDKEDLVVASEDGIVFDTLVGTMDTALSAGFPSVSLSEPGSTGL